MPADRLDRLDYYTLIGVEQDATEREIKRAFRQFARRYHPDRFAGTAGDRRARATAIYRRGTEGLQVLCDASARKLYDDGLRKGVFRLRADERDRAARQETMAPKKAEPAIRSQQARAFYDRGVAAARSRQYRAAWKALHQALELEPGNRKITRAIGKINALLRRNPG